MPIPETPYTREEAYLNAIATGDSGGIPETPYTREEMYLDYIARNGGGGGGGGSSTLSGLTDVDISNPTDGQTLVYNATSGKWENGAGGGGSSFLVIGGTYDADEDKTTLDKTWNEINNALIARAAIGQIFIHVVDPIEWVDVETISGCGFRGGIYVVDVDGMTYGCFGADDYPSNPLPPEPEDPELE